MSGVINVSQLDELFLSITASRAHKIYVYRQVTKGLQCTKDITLLTTIKVNKLILILYITDFLKSPLYRLAYTYQSMSDLIDGIFGLNLEIKGELISR